MKKIQFLYLTLIVFLCSGLAKADTNTYGIELDALPYVTGGYYLSAWAAYQNFRFRGVAATTTVPGFAVKSGFKDNKIDAYAFIIDYFPYEKYKGLWYGVGVERWNQSIKAKAVSGEGVFHNAVATAGLGYVWYFNKNIYINPWAAVHALITGTDDVQVGSIQYTPPRIVPEASVKIGFSF